MLKSPLQQQILYFIDNESYQLMLKMLINTLIIDKFMEDKGSLATAYR